MATIVARGSERVHWMPRFILNQLNQTKDNPISFFSDQIIMRKSVYACVFIMIIALLLIVLSKFDNIIILLQKYQEYQISMCLNEETIK